jgi:hypothetical protein
MYRLSLEVTSHAITLMVGLSACVEISKEIIVFSSLQVYTFNGNLNNFANKFFTVSFMKFPVFYYFIFKKDFNSLSGPLSDRDIFSK